LDAAPATVAAAAAAAAVASANVVAAIVGTNPAVAPGEIVGEIRSTSHFWIY
jgi:hypothetical protein